MRTPWTVLVYFAGEKDLAEAMILSLKQLYRVGVTGRCKVIVQFDPIQCPPQRFEIQKDDLDGGLRRVGITFPRASSALESFVTGTIRENPSEHYLLILSGHGSGVVGRKIDECGFSPGAKALELGPILASVRKKTGRVIDVLGIDACFMSMCEVCWELRGAVRFLVASEGLTPQYGWPYHRILELFRGVEAPSPSETSSAIVARYLRYRSDFDLAGQSVDLSACDVEKTDHLANAVRRLSRAMEARLTDRALRDAIVLSHWKAQSYKSEQYVDLWDLCDLLGEQSEDDAIRSACEAVKDAISDPVDGIVEKSIFHGPVYQHSHGLSVYFPWSAVSPAYRNYGFARETGWLDFLTSYVAATRREMRGVPRRRAS